MHTLQDDYGFSFTFTKSIFLVDVYGCLCVYFINWEASYSDRHSITNTLLKLVKFQNIPGVDVAKLSPPPFFIKDVTSLHVLYRSDIFITLRA